MRSVLAAGLLALAPMGALRAQCPDGTPPPCGPRPSRPAVSAPAPTSIAVLDFRNLSPDTSDAYLAGGLAEELTTRLGQVERIVVKARTAVERLRDAGAMNTTELGRALNVLYLVSGSVRRAGPRLRVSVQLLRAATGVQAWASQFDRDQADLLGIQEDIATAVTAAIAGRLLPAERTALAAQPTRNPVAYDAYLRGRAAYRADRYPEAIRLYRMATTLDSGFAEGFASLSLAHSAMFAAYYDRSDSELVLARRAADRAIALAPELPDGHLALGYYYYRGFQDYSRALDEFSTAQRTRPNDPRVRSAVANVARRQGRWDVSLASRERVLTLDPADTANVLELVATLQHLRRWDEADAYLDRLGADSVGVVTMYRAWGLLARGRLDQALSQLHRVPLGIRAIINMVSLETPALPAFVRLDPAIQDTIERATPPNSSPSPLERLVPLYLRAMTHAARGRDAQARASFDTVRVFFELGARARPDDAVLRGGLAVTYAGLGRFDEAKREVERAAQILSVSSDAFLGPGVALGQAQILAMAGDQDAAIDKLAYLLTIPAPVTRELLRVDPIWGPLRGNPRFQSLVAGN